MVKRIVLAIAVTMFLAGAPAYAGVDLGNLCTEAKARAAGKKASDLLKAFGKNTKKANATKLGADVSKAQSKFTRSFNKAESKGGCLTSGDSDAIEGKVDAFVVDAVGNICPACGDGILAPTEQCDDGNTVDGDCCDSTCQFEASGGPCGDGSDTECTDPNTCDGAGTCQDNNAASGAACGDQGVECVENDECDGNGNCTDRGFWPTGTPCVDTDDDPCTAAACDGDGTCNQQYVTISPHFTDNGDGTISDNCTGLMWEKKTGTAGVHNVSNGYTWAGCCDGDCGTTVNLCQPNAAAAALCLAQADGGTAGCSTCTSGTCNVDPMGQGALTTVWDWLTQLNTANFAGHSDWRLPSEGGRNSPATGTNELETILDLSVPGCGTGNACIDTIFGPTAAGGYYWSASTVTGDPGNARFVYFGDGNEYYGSKASQNVARAVR